eukprot:403354577
MDSQNQLLLQQALATMQQHPGAFQPDFSGQSADPNSSTGINSMGSNSALFGMFQVPGQGGQPQPNSAQMMGGNSLAAFGSHDQNQLGGVPSNQGGNNYADIMNQLSKLQQIVGSTTQSGGMMGGASAVSNTQMPVSNQSSNNLNQNYGIVGGMNDQQQTKQSQNVVGNDQQQQQIMNSNNANTSNNASGSNGQSVQQQSLNQQLQSSTNQQNAALLGSMQNAAGASLNPMMQMNSMLNPMSNPMAAAMGMGFQNPMMVPPAAGVMFPGMMGGSMDMSGAGGYNPFMMPFMNPQFMGGNQGNVAAFHQQGPKNEIKLFVGGLQFQTMEQDMFAYFSQFGTVGDAIVMRDKNTGRGRGFGFIRLIFKDDDEAQKMKDHIIRQNNDQSRGHFILDKKVDVKSADDYQGKTNQMQPQMNNPQMGGNPMIQKPNPYVIAETKTNEQEPGHVDVTFKYPKTKIFVGGLDFKLTVEELRQHFQQYGEVTDSIILKDIYTGQSRGFGFVSFKDEDVAQNLINNILVTTINGRKADIKTAEPKLNPFIPQKGGPHGGGGHQMYGGGPQGMMQQNGPAVIPQYSSRGGGYDEPHGGGHYGHHYDNRAESRDRGGRGGYRDRGNHDNYRKKPMRGSPDSSQGSYERGGGGFRSRSRSPGDFKGGRFGAERGGRHGGGRGGPKDSFNKRYDRDRHEGGQGADQDFKKHKKSHRGDRDDNSSYRGSPGRMGKGDQSPKMNKKRNASNERRR